MTNLQAVILAVGIGAAGLLNGGVWVLHRETGYMVNKFTGTTDTVANARRGNASSAMFGIPAHQ